MVLKMLWINIDKESEISLVMQVYKGIKSYILDCKLVAGQKLPSTRSLAMQLGISRNVILDVYEQLTAEGYVESKHGSGTRVADGVGLNRLPNKVYPQLLAREGKNSEDGLIDFRSGVPALELFPKKEWGKLLKEACDEASIQFLGYNSPEGIMELRREISEYLFRVRGIDCLPEQIFITSGATQGASLISKLLYNPDASINVEDPTNKGIFKVISSGYGINTIPVDSEGLMTEFLNEDSNVAFTYVTPSHQFPLGGILSAKRRIELINYARETKSYIIEDDYDSEFRYDGHPVSSIFELDPQRVIYIGSFSKIFAPALRLGYVILPDSLSKSFTKIKVFSDVHTEAFVQIAMAKYIKNGSLLRHINKMKKVYVKRRKVLIEELKANFESKVIISGKSTGLHIVAEFLKYEFSESFVQKAIRHGVRVYPVEYHAIKKGNHTNKLLMGYGHLSEACIKEGILRLKSVFL
jgi:GntR family transcriptional regulator / MocR family aminotransferase